jgi:hypothetical protein
MSAAAMPVTARWPLAVLARRHSVGSCEPNSAAPTASASQPSRTASCSATSRTRRAYTPLWPRRTASRPPPRPQTTITMLSRCIPGST